MPSMMQILKSNDLESQERHVQKLKREIDDMTVTLEINMDALQRLRSRQK